jgi:signal transduction histidine kinase
MQAIQSRRASGLVDQGQNFRALRCSEGGIAEGAGLAHDAGNLLGALTLYSELLAMPGVLHEEYRAFAGELRLLSDRSWAMINRLVNHARGEREQEESEPVSLPEIVERCRGVLSRVAGRPVEVAYGGGAYELVNVRAEAVERILTNLVKNAAEAMVGAESITVSVEGALDAGRRRVVMTVQDQGCGMSAAAVGRLMRAGGISSASGRGIGFCVVRELVAMSGGCLNLHSEVGAGTSISVEWYAAEVGVVACGQQDAVAC